jgi:hypothetical protein
MALLRAWYVDDLEGALAHFVADDHVVALVGVSADTPIATDEANPLEYAFARSLGAPSADLVDDLRRLAADRGSDRPSMLGSVDWARVEELRPRSLMEESERVDEIVEEPKARARARAFESGCYGDASSVVDLWGAQDREPMDTAERFVLGLGHAVAGDIRSLALASEIHADGFVAEAELVRARYAWASTEHDRTLDALERALADLREQPFVLCDVGIDVIDLVREVAAGDEDRARRGAEMLLRAPLAAYAEEHRRVHAAQTLAAEVDDADLCMRALGIHLDIPSWRRDALEFRRRCLERAQHPLAPRAAADLEAFVAASPGSFTELFADSEE